MIAFYFNYAGEYRLTERLLGQLQHFYPDADVVCIKDTDADCPCPGHGGDHLKTPETITQFVKRNLETVLAQSTAEIFIQVDPDTFFWKKFNAIPSADWFGYSIEFDTVAGRLPLIVGCCQGFSRSCLTQILSSRLIDQAPDSFMPFAKEDLIISWVCRELGIKPTPWDEVSHTQGNINKQHPPYRYAVTHPCKAAIDYHRLNGTFHKFPVNLHPTP